MVLKLIGENLFEIKLTLATAGGFTVLFFLLKIILNFFTFWTKRFDNAAQINILSRILSSIHATIATVFGFGVLFFDTDIYWNQPIYKSFRISYTIAFTVGYLFHDLIMMIIYKEIREFGYLLHHCASIFAGYLCIARGVFSLMAILRLVTEISTPFINNRWFMYALNMKHTRLYLYNGYLMMLMFFIFRIIPIIPIWYHYFDMKLSPKWELIDVSSDIFCVVTSLSVDFLNVYWFYKIVLGSIKYRKESSKKD